MMIWAFFGPELAETVSALAVIDAAIETTDLSVVTTAFEGSALAIVDAGAEKIDWSALTTLLERRVVSLAES